MYFASLFLFISTLFAALTVASPLDMESMEKRAPGPSGQVLSPVGGANIPSTQGYPTGKINFSYKPVYISKSSNCGYYGCTAQTWYVSVALRDSKGTTTTLASYLGGQDVNSNIQATLTVPANFCGKYSLVVREYQNLYGQNINFQAAAPQINIECDPLP